LVKTIVTGAVGLAAVAACAIALSARDSTAREIRIVARGMTFYLDGGTEPNPVLRVRRGEDVRIVFVNQDAGMKHDFTVPDWGLETRALSGRGETSISFRVPASSGPGTYACTPHATMMRGTIAVE
jgi:plastocyanin domain-containing protein